MELLTDNTSHLVNIRGIWDRYLAENPRLADRTYANAVRKINAELPNYITAVSSTSASAVATTVVKESTSEIKELIALLTSVIAKANTGRNPKPTPTGVSKKYCFVHGSNHTHIGTECKVMLNPTSTYTAAQKTAKVPALIDSKQGKA